MPYSFPLIFTHLGVDCGFDVQVWRFNTMVLANLFIDLKLFGPSMLLISTYIQINLLGKHQTACIFTNRSPTHTYTQRE